MNIIVVNNPIILNLCIVHHSNVGFFHHNGFFILLVFFFHFYNHTISHLLDIYTNNIPNTKKDKFIELCALHYNNQSI